MRLLADLRDQPRERGDARQQHIAFPQPAHRVGEEGLRTVPVVQARASTHSRSSLST